MRIGEASKRSGVPVSTIRYYIRRGLIVPDGEGTQYLFDEQDCHTLERIVQFKKWGLSLETAHRLLSLERVSSGVEQDMVEDCVALLRTHQKQLEDQRVRYQHYKEEINEFIDELNRQAAAPHGSALAPTGVPLPPLLAPLIMTAPPSFSGETILPAPPLLPSPPVTQPSTLL